MLKPLDVIALRVAVDSWEPGTVATVLEVAPGSVLAEVSDDDGRTLDILTIPVDAAKLVEGDEDVRSCPQLSAVVRSCPKMSGETRRGAVPRRYRRRRSAPPVAHVELRLIGAPGCMASGRRAAARRTSSAVSGQALPVRRV